MSQLLYITANLTLTLFLTVKAFQGEKYLLTVKRFFLVAKVNLTVELVQTVLDRHPVSLVARLWARQLHLFFSC